MGRNLLSLSFTRPLSTVQVYSWDKARAWAPAVSSFSFAPLAGAAPPWSPGLRGRKQEVWPEVIAEGFFRGCGFSSFKLSFSRHQLACKQPPADLKTVFPLGGKGRHSGVGLASTSPEVGDLPGTDHQSLCAPVLVGWVHLWVWQ